MTGRDNGWQARVGSWLVLALAAAVVADVVWTLIEPLIVPACFVLVGVLVIAVLARWFTWRNRW